MKYAKICGIIFQFKQRDTIQCMNFSKHQKKMSSILHCDILIVCFNANILFHLITCMLFITELMS